MGDISQDAYDRERERADQAMNMLARVLVAVGGEAKITGHALAVNPKRLTLERYDDPNGVVVLRVREI